MLRTYKILIVDDDATYRNVLGVLMKKVGQIFLASSGNEAIEVLKANPIDIVFSDILMPDGTGMDLLAWIQQASMPVRPPVVLISGQSQVTAEDAYTKGAYGMIGKPFRMQAIIEIFDKFKAGEKCPA